MEIIKKKQQSSVDKPFKCWKKDWENRHEDKTTVRKTMEQNTKYMLWS